MNKVKELFNQWFLNFGSYFKYNFKNSLKSILLILAFGLVVYIFPLSDERSFKSTTNVGLLITYVGCLCYIVPIFQMNYLKRKRILDCYYSIPIDKKSLVLNNYLNGLLQILIPYVLLYWSGFLITITSKTSDFYRFEYYVPLFFLVLLFIISIYSINTFIVSQSNTNIDATINLLFVSFFITIILSTFNLLFITFSKENNTLIDVECFVLFYPLVTVGNYYNNLIIQEKYYDYTYWDLPTLSESEIASFIVLVTLGIIATILLVFYCNKHKAENAEEITLSPFGYTTFLPVYLFCSLFIISFEGADSLFIWVFIIFAIYLIFKVIQYRKIKLSPKLLILPVIITFVAILLGVIFLEIYESKFYEITPII